MDSRNIRKYRDKLKTAGTGVIVFFIWSTVKIVISDIDTNFSALRPILDTMPSIAEKSIILGFYYLTLAAIIAIELHIGFSARREAMGKKQRKGYIVWAFIMLSVSLTVNIKSIVSFFADAQSSSSLLMSLVALSFDYALLQVIIYAFRLRRELKTISEGMVTG